MSHIKVSRTQANEIANALRSLAGEFEPKTRYAIAKNLIIFSRVARDTEKWRVNAICELSPEEKSLKPGTPEHKAFADAYIAYLTSEVEFSNVLTLKLDGLDLEKNNIPIDLINALLPILDDQVDLPASVTG